MRSGLILLPVFLLALPLFTVAQFSSLTVATEQLSGPAESPTSIAAVAGKLYGTFRSSRVYFFMDGGGLMYSTDDGHTWVPDPLFAGKHIVHTGYFNNALFAVEYEKTLQPNNTTWLQTLRIHRSTDNGASFAIVKEINDTAAGNPPYGYFKAGIFREVNGVLFLTYTDNFQDWKGLHSIYSTDGINWNATQLNHLTFDAGEFKDQNKISGSEGWFFCNTGWGDAIFAAQSPDFSNAQLILFPEKAHFVEVYSIGGKLIAFTNNGVYTTTTWFNPWSIQFSYTNGTGACTLKDGYFHLSDGRGGFYRAQADQPESPVLMHFIPGEISLPEFGQVADDLYLLGYSMMRSTDNGLSWSSPESNLPAVTFLTTCHNWLWTQKGFVYRSLDGAHWSLLQPQGLPVDSYDWEKMVEIQGRMFLTGTNVYYSDDGGATWVLSFDPPANNSLSKVIVDVTGTLLYCLADYWSTATDLYVSEDKGATWEKINDPNPSFGNLAAKGDTIFCGNNNQLAYSYDRGATWNTTLLNFSYPEIFLSPDGQLVLTYRINKSVYLSTDWGQNFTQTLQMPAPIIGASKQDSLLILSITLFSLLNDNRGTYLSNNNGVSGVVIKDTDWQSIQGCVLKDGYLYGSNGGTVRTELQPILDALQYLDDFGTVEAKVFFDRNQNCVQDPGEESVAGHPVVFQPGDFIATSGNDGVVRRVLPSQVYSAQLNPYPFTTLINCQPLTNIGVTPGNVTNLTLGMKPQGVADMALHLSASPLRPGFDGSFTITVENKGVEPVAGGAVLRFSYPDNEVTFLDAIPAPASVGPGVLEFVVPDMPVFSSFTFRIKVTVPPDPALTGHYVVVDAQLPPPYFDQAVWNHQLSRAFRITSSFDPNDKTAFTNAPGGNQMTALEKNLQYLIRFQNTGTDTAFSIVVADTLSPLLDWTTLKTISASHPYRMTVADPGVVRWRFDNILLPDSTTNEPASHGFVLFSIDKKDNTIVGDTLKNSAAIYFDFNHPAITNTTETRIVRRLIYREMPSGPSRGKGIEIIPNPVGEQLTWRMAGTAKGMFSASIYDESGHLVSQLIRGKYVESEGEMIFRENTGHLAAGAYRLVVIWGDEILTAPFIRL